ncbi:putative sulfate exporter family transporter [Frigidibacter sp. MR17.14]|uniref:YeiH family protein n=1 Tax=Frigidibacter sp. MR17.14 TaxID=3126509 RepID=UPI003012ED5D
MSVLTPLRPPHPVLPGLAGAATLAVAASALVHLPGLGALSPLILAILLGLCARSLLGALAPARVAPLRAGSAFAMRRVLRAGIVLLGLQVTLGQLASVGLGGLALVATVLGATFVFTCALGRVLGVEAGLSRLIAAGTSVCGASAVVAANAVIGARDEDAAYAVACVTIFGTLSMLAFPALGTALDLAPGDYGLWTGAAIHEVAQVVAAGSQHGAAAGEAAILSKLARVAMLAPLVACLALATRAERGGAAARAPFPWFVAGFLGAILLASTGWVPQDWLAASRPLTTALLAIALAAMGFETHVAGLRARGLRPLALAAAAWIFISALALVLVWLRGAL